MTDLLQQATERARLRLSEAQPDTTGVAPAESVIAPTTSPAPAGSDLFAEAAARAKRRLEENRTRRFNLEQAQTSDPMKTAEALKLSDKTGIPVDPLLRNIEAYRQKDAVAKAEQMLDVSVPVLRDKIANDRLFTTLARDDLNPLAELEKVFSALRPYNLGKTIVEGVVEGAKATGAAAVSFAQDPLGATISGARSFGGGLVQGAAGVAGFAQAQAESTLAANRDLEEATGTVHVPRVADLTAPVLGWIQNKLSDTSEAIIGPTDPNATTIDKGFRSGLQSLAAQLPLYVASGLTRSPGPALYGMFAQAQGLAYARARDKGLSEGMSYLDASIDATIEIATEMIPAIKLLDDLTAGTGFVRMIANQLVREIPGEQVATVLQDLNEWAFERPNASFMDYLRERPGAAAQTLVATIVQTGIQTGAINLIAGQADQDAAAAAAQQYGETMTGALNAAAASTLRENAPATFQEFAQSAAQAGDGAAETTWIDARTLQEGAGDALLQTLYEAVPDLQAQLADAVEAGVDVAIPTAAILTHAAGTPAADLFLQQGKFNPRDQTLADQQFAAEEGKRLLAERAAAVQEQADDAQAWIDDAEAVRADMEQEIISKGGMYTPDAAKNLSMLVRDFVSVMASDLGQRPTEFWSKYRLSVVGRGATDLADAYDQEIRRPAVSDNILANTNVQWVPISQLQAFAAQDRAKTPKGEGNITQPTETLLPELTTAFAEGEEIQEPLTLGYDYENGTALLTDGNTRLAALAAAGFTEAPVVVSREMLAGFGRAAPRAMRAEDAIAAERVLPSDVGFGAGALKQAARVTTGRSLFEDVIESVGLTEQEVDSTAIEWMTGLGGEFDFLPPAAGGLAETVKAIHERRMQTGLPVLDITKAEDRATLARMIAAEALIVMKGQGTALQWYDQTVRDMLAKLSVKHPELLTDPRARNAMLMATAIASQNMDPNDNLRFAEKQYDAYQASVDPATGIGQFPEEGTGAKSGSMRDNFVKANTLLREMGPDKLMRFLATPFTVRELRDANLPIPSGEALDTLVLGSAVFGPKIGFGFYSNLTGNFDPVTMDMWFMRTVGRLTGTLPMFTPELFKKQMDKMAAAIKQRGSKDRGFFAAQFPKDLVDGARTSDDGKIALAREVVKRHESDFKKNRAKYDAKTRTKSDLVLASERLLGIMEGPRDVPSSGAERNNLRDVVSQAVEIVSAQYGQRVPPAALQALIWYPEQELYSAFGVKLKSTSTDYSDAAEKVLTAAGITSDQLSSAVEQARAGNLNMNMRSTPFDDAEREAFMAERKNRELATKPQVSLEIAPNPDDAALAARWNALPSETRKGISGRVLNKTLPKVMRLAKAAGEARLQIGSFEDDTNTSFAIAVTRGDAATLTDILGYVFRQKAMMVVAPEAFDGSTPGGMLDIEVGDISQEEIDRIYQSLRPLGINGQSTVGGTMSVLVTDQAVDVEALANSVHSTTGLDVVWHATNYGFPGEAEYGSAKGYTGRDGEKVGSRIDSVRDAASKELERELAAAERAQQAAGEVSDARGTDQQQADTGAVQGSPGVSGSGVVLEQSGRQNPRDDSPLLGLPATVNVDGKPVTFGPFAPAREAARSYMAQAGLPYDPPTVYARIDRARARRIANAFEDMKHDPTNPDVKAAYDAMIAETLAQWQAIKATGLQVEFIEGADPYGNPRNAILDVVQNNHLWVYPTDAGFGGSESLDVDITGNPLLQIVEGETISGKQVRANDIFRIVHDYFGHIKEGVGFRAEGEENAWQHHMAMYSPLAQKAMTVETRGQNSWVNFGPYSEFNKTASGADTQYAPQKIGLLPDWVLEEGYLGGAKAEDTGALDQGEGTRGSFNPSTREITLLADADMSTFLHELGHFFLEATASVASQANAPARVTERMNGLLKWFGVKDLATWNAMTLDEKRPYHEKFAESYEQYLFEGKAPSVELQEPFRNFSRWLKQTYRSITDFLRGRDLRLTDEVRAIMDRMLATEEQIAQVEQAHGMQFDNEATAEAMERLQSRSLRDLKWTKAAMIRALRNVRKDVAAKRKVVQAEITKQVQSEPVYVLMRWLRKGIAPGGAETQMKISTEALKEMYGEEGNAAWRYLPTNVLASEGGFHPDMIVDWLPGKPFPTGDALVRAILAATPEEQEIEGRTDTAMLERYGDIVTVEGMERAADEAVHNEARARSLASELRSQAEALNPRKQVGTNVRGRRITVNALVAAAQDFAARVTGRTKVKDLLKRGNAHRAAEARAGRAWTEATVKGKSADAVQAKQDQLLNNLTAKEMLEAQAKVKKYRVLFRRVLAKGSEGLVKSGRSPDIVFAARALLGQYLIGPGTEKTARQYMALVSAYEPHIASAMNAAVTKTTDAVPPRPMDELTFDELTTLYESVYAIWLLSKDFRGVEVGDRKVSDEEVEEELLSVLSPDIPDTLPGDKSAPTDKELRAGRLRNWAAALTRVEQWAEAMDGKWGGPFTRLLFQPIKQAADRYRTERLVYRKKYLDLLQAVKPFMPKGKIEAPEIGYTFGEGHNNRGIGELMHAILHMGNGSNRMKLLIGRGWATVNPDGSMDTSRWDAFLDRMHAEGKITKEHWDFAQGVWDMLEELKPGAQRTHRKVFGRYFSEITAEPVVTPFGTYRGGYVPAQIDGSLPGQGNAAINQAVTASEENAFTWPSTNRGFTETRDLQAKGRKLQLNLNALNQHIDKVLMFTHMEGAVTDANRILHRHDLAKALDAVSPSARAGLLIPWLQRAARQTLETQIPAADVRFLTAARARAGMSLMFANVINTLQQATGIVTALPKVGALNMKTAMAQYLAHPLSMKAHVASQSAYMKDRMMNEVSAINSLGKEIILDATVMQKAQDWTARHAYFMQAAFDGVLSPIVWTAAWNQAQQEGMSEADAVAYADSVVRQTQGTTLPEDVSRIETGNPWWRMFIQFYGYMNMILNTNVSELYQIARDAGLPKTTKVMKGINVIIVGYMMQQWVAEAIALAARGGPPDDDEDGVFDDWLWNIFGLGTVKAVTGSIPFGGQVAQLAASPFTSQRFDDRLSLSPAVGMLESGTRSVGGVYKLLDDNENNDPQRYRVAMDVATTVGMMFGLPLRPAAKPITYLMGVADGDIEPTSEVDLIRGMITGSASPESRAQN